MKDTMKDTLNDFLEIEIKEKKEKHTDEVFIVEPKNDIVEKINKKFLTEDGRQLLQD
jgi:hypothetical protein